MSAGASFVVAVAVFVFRGERLLAMRRARGNEAAPGAWETPSGRLGPGEQPLDAARRETMEECGLAIRLAPRPVTAYVAKRNRDDMLVVVYRGTSDSGEVALSEEHDAFAWMTLEEFGAACRFAPLVRAAVAAAGAPAGAPAGTAAGASSGSAGGDSL